MTPACVSTNPKAESGLEFRFCFSVVGVWVFYYYIFLACVKDVYFFKVEYTSKTLHINYMVKEQALQHF